MATSNVLRIGGILLVLVGLVFLVAGYAGTQQSLYGAAAALLCTGSLLVALAGNQKRIP